MEVLSEKTFSKVLGTPLNDNARSILLGLNTFGKDAGLDLPHRLAPYLAQLAHESQGTRHDREIWGPTKAQKGYEGREDLGNTEPGDGSKFRGYTPIQITGRANTTDFHRWCLKNFPDHDVPDFVETPRLMNTDPWEGIAPIWYWITRDLNRYSDVNDFENQTRRINGGLNGFADRCQWYAFAALALLDLPRDIKAFQRSSKLTADGQAGPKTRAALHQRLAAMPAQEAPLAANLGRLKAVQTDLKTLGLYTGRVDGIWGDRSQTALVALQEAHARITANLAPEN